MASTSTILGMGNPLLDMSAVVDPAMLKKYNLNENDAILYEKEDIFEDLKADYDVEYIAGGATQNACRVAQWILEKPESVAYFGCVGEDESSSTLAKVATESGLKVLYQKHESLPTGRCAVLVTGVHRSLVTKLDAANHFTQSHLQKPDNWKAVQDARVYYSAGFFLTVSPDSMVEVAKHAADSPGKCFSMNLSAPFICQFFKDPLQRVLKHADLVFGNETEADAFAEHNGFPELKGDRRAIALKIASLPYEGAEGKSRTVVITQGCHPCLVVDGGKLTEYPVLKLETSQIVDTNGAGDAFVGGYLAQLALGKPTPDCVKCGLWAAKEILQVSGCKATKNKY